MLSGPPLLSPAAKPVSSRTLPARPCRARLSYCQPPPRLLKWPPEIRQMRRAGPSSGHQLTPSMVNLPDEDSDMDSRDYFSEDPGFLTSSSNPAASFPSYGPVWEYSLSKHRAKKLRRAARDAQTSSSSGAAISVSGTPSNSNVPSPDITRKPGPCRPGLPPLPKRDLKIVIRPTRGLALKQYPNHAISAATVMSCQNLTHVEGKYAVCPHMG